MRFVGPMWRLDTATSPMERSCRRLTFGAVVRFVLKRTERMKQEGQVEGRELESRSPRIDAQFVVRLCCVLGEFPARVINLSSSGFRLRTARTLEPGWEVTLQVPKRPPVRCVIRWARGKEAGGVFLEAVAL